MGQLFPGAIIFLGPPGSGKGTQADTFADSRDGYYHFDTGRELNVIFEDPKNRDNAAIQMRHEQLRRGELVDPDWVTSVVCEGIRRVANSGKGVIFSGSPRTLQEARAVVPLLMDVYGRDSLVVGKLNVNPETSIHRNTSRRVCVRCARPLLSTTETRDMAFCPVSGGELAVRKDDTEEIMKNRLDQYRRRTEPIYEYYQTMGIPIFDIDGERSPEEIHLDISDTIDKYSR